MTNTVNEVKKTSRINELDMRLSQCYIPNDERFNEGWSTESKLSFVAKLFDLNETDLFESATIEH